MSERELIFRVALRGQAEFARDFRGLHELQRKMATEELAIAASTSRGKRRVADDEARHRSALMKTQIAFEKARARESVREAERAEKAKTKALQQEEKQRQRSLQGESKALVRAKLEETRAFERAEREKTRIAQREARARQREEEAAQRFAMRAQEATSRHIMREREKAQRQAEREAYVAQRDELFNRKRFFRGVGTGLAQGAFGAIQAGTGYALGMAKSIGHATGAFDAFDIGDIVSERMQAKALMRSAAIEAREAGNTFGADFDEVAGYAKVRDVAKRFGISQRDLLGAIDAASEKGSGADAVKNLERIAMQATAMGTDATTIAKMRAQLKMSADVAGKPLNDDQIDKMMAKMHFIGKTGVFRAEDIAKESESLFSSFVKGGGDLESGFDRYISFANEARKSVGSGSMARTAIMGVQDAIAKKESKINKLGIKTRDTDGSQRDFIEVVMDVIAKTGGKGEKFNAIFDPSKAGKAIATMVTAFNTGSHFGKDVAAGRAEMVKLLAGKESIQSASVAEMQKDAELRMDDQGVRIRKAVETIRQSLADKLTPILEKFAKHAPQFAESFGKILDLIVSNPWKAAGGAIAANALINGGKAAALPMGGAVLRYFGDLFAQKTMGMGGAAKALGSAAGTIGGAISRMGATNVYIVGAAPGVLGGGGGGGLPVLGGVGGAGGLGGMTGMGAALGAVGIGAAIAAVMAPIIQDALDKSRNSTFSTEKYNAGLKEIADDKAHGLTADNLAANLGGYASEIDKQDAFAVLEKYAPSIAAKVKSGEMSSSEAGTEILKEQTAKVGALAGKVDSEGKFTTSKRSEEELNKLLDALATLASKADGAAKAMGGIQPPNTSMLKFTPVR